MRKEKKEDKTRTRNKRSTTRNTQIQSYIQICLKQQYSVEGSILIRAESQWMWSSVTTTTTKAWDWFTMNASQQNLYDDDEVLGLKPHKLLSAEVVRLQLWRYLWIWTGIQESAGVWEEATGEGNGKESMCLHWSGTLVRGRDEDGGDSTGTICPAQPDGLESILDRKRSLGADRSSILLQDGLSGILSRKS